MFASKAMALFSATPTFVWSANADGLAIRFSRVKDYARAKQGRCDETGQLGFIRMQMLAECGQAEVREVDSGIFIAAVDAVRLDRETREGFLLPPPWPGGMRLQTGAVPQSSSFSARLGLVDPGADVRWEWKLSGPILEVEGESYLPTAAQYAALLAFDNWSNGDDRDEMANLSLLATLREAREADCHIDLEAYRETLIANAQELSIDARPQSGSGDLILRPVVSGDFPELNADEIERRLGQVSGDAQRAVLRVGQTIVLLDPTQTRQARALVERGRVPQSEVIVFHRDPSAWMAEHVFPDIETEFSPRGTGIGFWKPGYAGSMWEEGEDWFGKKPQPEKKPVRKDGERDSSEGNCGQAQDDDGRETKPVVPQIIDNDAGLGYGWRDPQMDTGGEEPDFSRYARDPMKHQREAVHWLLRPARRAMRRRECLDELSGLGAGALLADDMGLGKTFSTLIFMREWLDLWRLTVGGEPPAVLIVAPLSLLENWKAEIAKSYGDGDSVFTRVLMAQSDGELNRVRRRPGSRDKAVPGDVLEYGLGFGDGTARSIDLPGSCVLTTYQTLRDYRFSFAKAEWSAAIFDEAQNIKNPNALQTIAAKSLKALFRLTLTGTPVENHLGDFWSILDTSEPGPLGSFAEFRTNWIVPMTRERDRMGEIGLSLRAHVGDLMLRRMKEDELTGLPKKRGHDQALPVEMTLEQVSAYDAIIASTQGEVNTGESSVARQNRQLAALWQLRQVSLHPDLLAGGSIGTAANPRDSRAILQRSGKLTWLLALLDVIEPLNEKVLVFCVQKKLQEALARHLALIYGLKVPVINGDTKATSRHDPDKTRLGLIEQFSKKEGFGICILSPIAAGAGLNPVTVYLPAVRHPDLKRRSFDDVLHGLIAKKRGLQGALGLVPPQSVSDSELIAEVLAPNLSPSTTAALDLAAALHLPSKLFEALIALLYEGEAQRVILTPSGSEQGSEVVVLGWGAQRENILIRCNATSHDELDCDVAPREIEGVRPDYERALGVSFDQRRWHTTASRLTKRTQQIAQICKVSVYNRAWLSAELNQNKISLADLLAKDSRRECAE